MGNIECSTIFNPGEGSCKYLYYFSYIINGICMIVRTAFILIVSFQIFKKRQFGRMATIAKLSFLGYIVQWIILNIYFIYGVTTTKQLHYLAII